MSFFRKRCVIEKEKEKKKKNLARTKRLAERTQRFLVLLLKNERHQRGGNVVDERRVERSRENRKISTAFLSRHRNRESVKARERDIYIFSRRVFARVRNV